MNDISKLRSELNDHIDKLGFGDHPKELYDPIHYIMSLGGKRMRPILVLLGHHLFDQKDDQIINVAAAIEAFHNFTLLHDDIMDNAPIRRGKDTVHVKWNVPTAILAGDVMLVGVYKMLLNALKHSPKQFEILELFNQTAAEVCEGQQIDMNFEGRNNVTESEYLDMIRLKTAVLLAASLKIGALMGGASDREADLLYNFGQNMGIGFQLMDDLLDVYADKKKFGKQVGGDIISNKKTYLLIKALENAKGENKEKLDYWINAANFNPVEKVKSVTSIYNALDIKVLTSGKMNQYFSEAFQALEELKIPTKEKENLRGFTESLIVREY